MVMASCVDTCWHSLQCPQCQKVRSLRMSGARIEAVLPHFSLSSVNDCQVTAAGRRAAQQVLRCMHPEKSNSCSAFSHRHSALCAGLCLPSQRLHATQRQRTGSDAIGQQLACAAPVPVLARRPTQPLHAGSATGHAAIAEVQPAACLPSRQSGCSSELIVCSRRGGPSAGVTRACIRHALPSARYPSWRNRQNRGWRT